MREIIPNPNTDLTKEEQQSKNAEIAIETITNKSEGFEELNKKITEYYTLHFSPKFKFISIDKKSEEPDTEEKRKEIKEELIKYGAIKKELKDEYGLYFTFVLEEWKKKIQK